MLRHPRGVSSTSSVPGTYSPGTACPRRTWSLSRQTPSTPLAVHSSTRGLARVPLTHALGQANQAQQRKLLVATGDYLRRMHAVTFAHSGYLMYISGPLTPPTEQEWQHRSWSPHLRQTNALALLAARGAEL